MLVPSNLCNTNQVAVTLTGQLISDEIAEKVSIETVQYLVENFPQNSFGMFYNDCFEDENFVFIINGKWYFFDVKFEHNNASDIIQDWDWSKDPMNIIESYEGDFDEIERFNNGWLYISRGYFEDDDVIFERFTPTSPMIQMPLPQISDTGLKSEIFFKSEIKKIISNDNLSLDEKTEILYNMVNGK